PPTTGFARRVAGPRRAFDRRCDRQAPLSPHRGPDITWFQRVESLQWYSIPSGCPGTLQPRTCGRSGNGPTTDNLPGHVQHAPQGAKSHRADVLLATAGMAIRI